MPALFVFDSYENLLIAHSPEAEMEFENVSALKEHQIIAQKN